MKPLLLICLLLSFIGGAARAQFIPPVDCVGNGLGCYVAKLESKRLPLFYGSAILFHWDDDYLWFMTSSHLMPRSKVNREALRVRTPIFKYVETSLEIIGEARGIDVAVVRARRPSTDEIRAGRAKLAGAFGNSEVSHKGVNIELIGVPGMPSTYSEVRTARHERLWLPNEKQAIDLELKSKCPVPFLSQCYRLPILSWGFSGGALIMDKNGRSQIMGMVSHFSPLGGETYAIPVHIALATASEIKRTMGDVTRDADEFFELTRAGIKILKGDFAGKMLQAVGGGLFAEGGDESSGGGDESSGGGDESSGGGDESSGGGGGPQTVNAVRNAKGHIARLGSFSEIETAITSPLLWKSRSNALGSLLPYFYPFKGIRAWMQYEPGIYLDGKRVYGLGETSVGNAQQFLAAYREGAISLRFESRPFRLPQQLSSDTQIRGLFSIGSVRRFKSMEELNAMNGRFTRNDVGFELKNELEQLITVHAKGGIDLTIGQVASWPYSAMPNGSLSIGGSETSGTFSDPEGYKIAIRFPSQWRAEGDRFYRQIGALWVTEKGIERKVSAITSLQWNPDSRVYELRVFWAYSEPDSEQEPGGFLSRDHIHLRALSANLVP